MKLISHLPILLLQLFTFESYLWLPCRGGSVAGALPTQATIAPSTSSLVSPNHGRRRHRRQKWLPLQHDHDRIPRTNSGDSVPLVISAVLASDTGHDVPLDRHSDIIASNRPSRRDRLGLTVNSAVVASPTSSLSQTLWPPWPFNMLKRRSEDDTSHIGSSFAKGGADDRPLRPMSAAAVAWSFTKSSAHLGVRSVQEIGSQLWFHSPPAFPPLVVYALWPRRIAVPPPAALPPNQIADGVATSGMLSSLQALVHQTQIPLFSNPLIRNVVGIGTSLALLSWAHAELQRHKRLTPLPLVHQYRDMNRAQLPPFLPDQVFSLAISETAVSSTVPSLTTMPSRANEQNDGPSSRRRHPILVQWEKVRDTMSVRRAWSSWRTKREQTLAMRQNAHRLAVYDELLSLRAAERMHKRQKATTTRLPSSESSKLQQGGQPRAGLHWNPFVLWQRYRSRGSVNIQLENAPPLGHALVTGASAGIGRAIAVELARWKIPLILVARDINALNDLAIDLEACYGVDCAVLSADLSQPGSAERIYEAVTDAGLRVDVLVNNAGISSHGESVNLSLNQVDNMIQVNAVSVSTLTHLFGRDMKERQRGRILIVSSICGEVDGIASVAVYSATKAFENSLGISIGKELEPYGVGVTCLLPGAVRGTEFRSRSNSQEALCWKVPFYAKTAASVAESGVRAMLHGDTEVTPGVLNRIFLKGLKPVLPQRLHNLLAEIMWNPLELPFRRRNRSARLGNVGIDVEVDNASTVDRPRRMILRPASFCTTKQPRLLELRAEHGVIVEEALSSTTTIDSDELNATAIPVTSANNITQLDTAIEAATPAEAATSDMTLGLINDTNNVNASERSIPTLLPREAPTMTSPTEIELLLEQYGKHRSFDPFGEKQFFRDPLAFRLEALMHESQR